MIALNGTSPASLARKFRPSRNTDQTLSDGRRHDRGLIGGTAAEPVVPCAQSRQFGAGQAQIVNAEPAMGMHSPTDVAQCEIGPGDEVVAVQLGFYQPPDACGLRDRGFDGG